MQSSINSLLFCPQQVSSNHCSGIDNSVAMLYNCHVLLKLSIEPGYWNTMQTNLHLQLKAFPLQHFVTHRGLLVSHPLPGEPSISILDKVCSSQALIRFQQQTDYDKWGAFVNTCKLLSVMRQVYAMHPKVLTGPVDCLVLSWPV